MTTRREFLKWTAASGAGLVVGSGALGRPGAGGVGGARGAGRRRPDAVSGSDADARRQRHQRDRRRTTVDLSTALISRKLHSQLPETPLFGYLGRAGRRRRRVVPGAGDRREERGR